MSSSPLAIARACLKAYVDRDLAAMERLLDKDFHFTSPLDNALDRAAYFKICWPNSAGIVGFNCVHEAEAGEHAFIVYEAHTSSGKTFRNGEVYTVQGDKLVATEVYFGWNVPHNVIRGTHAENQSNK
jgi:hypothetical protein